MKWFKYITFSMLIFIGLSNTSCSEDFLETTSTSQISSTSISNSVDGLYIALNGIHRKMVSQDLGIQGMGAEPGFMFTRDAHGDDFTWASNTWVKTHLNWTINKDATSAYNAGIWRTYYQFILNANMILEALQTVPINGAVEEKLAENIKGEALCIRAWAHFNLVQYYAQPYVAGNTNSQLGIPYRESSDPVNVPRNTVEEVYTKINADLDDATTLLQGYSAPLNHYTEKVAWGLKARVALTQGNYEKAGDYAANAISVATADGLQILQQNQLNLGFVDITSNTKEAMYAAMTQDDQSVYFYSFYAYMSWNFSASAIRGGVKCINQATYDQMSATDLRRAWWDPTGTAAVPATTYVKKKYQNRKFTARSTASAVGDVAFMRLSEMYLIAAEGYARAGVNTKAQQYFQTFINQRDPSYGTVTKTGTALADEVVFNRRIELWGEGFRWFDLKRLNLPCDRNGSNFDISFCGFLYKDHTTNKDDGWWYEIPKAETDYNTLMEKNY